MQTGEWDKRGKELNFDCYVKILLKNTTQDLHHQQFCLCSYDISSKHVDSTQGETKIDGSKTNPIQFRNGLMKTGFPWVPADVSMQEEWVFQKCMGSHWGTFNELFICGISSSWTHLLQCTLTKALVHTCFIIHSIKAKWVITIERIIR